ncbi:acyl-CoA dehydrogenase family protein [Nocardia grenadensis]
MLAFALTEPDHGTGADLGTPATASGTGYVLNGGKWSITNSDIAAHLLVFAKTGPRQVSVSLVERDAPGFGRRPIVLWPRCRRGEPTRR